MAGGAPGAPPRVSTGVTVVPRSGALSMRMLPPCAKSRCRAPPRARARAPGGVWWVKKARTRALMRSRPCQAAVVKEPTGACGWRRVAPGAGRGGPARPARTRCGPVGPWQRVPGVGAEAGGRIAARGIHGKACSGCGTSRAFERHATFGGSSGRAAAPPPPPPAAAQGCEAERAALLPAEGMIWRPGRAPARRPCRDLPGGCACAGWSGLEIRARQRDVAQDGCDDVVVRLAASVPSDLMARIRAVALRARCASRSMLQRRTPRRPAAAAPPTQVSPAGARRRQLASTVGSAPR